MVKKIQKYRYEAFDSRSNTQRGVIEADCETTAIEELRAKGLFLQRIELDSAEPMKTILPGKSEGDDLVNGNGLIYQEDRITEENKRFAPFGQNFIITPWNVEEPKPEPRYYETDGGERGMEPSEKKKKGKAKGKTGRLPEHSVVKSASQPDLAAEAFQQELIGIGVFYEKAGAVGKSKFYGQIPLEWIKEELEGATRILIRNALLAYKKRVLAESANQ